MKTAVAVSYTMLLSDLPNVTSCDEILSIKRMMVTGQNATGAYAQRYTGSNTPLGRAPPPSARG